MAAARPRLKTLLQEAKSHADGWSSGLLQRVLAGVLQDEGLASWLERVRNTYRTRRERVAEVMANCGIPGVVAWPARDGVNLWIHLPSGFDAGEGRSAYSLLSVSLSLAGSQRRREVQCRFGRHRAGFGLRGAARQSYSTIRGDPLDSHSRLTNGGARAAVAYWNHPAVTAKDGK